jgi:hypothetical protein
VIRKRYQVYKTETEVVAEHYKAQDKFEVLKGEGTVDEIFEALRNSIEREMAAEIGFLRFPVPIHAIHTCFKPKTRSIRQRHMHAFKIY